MAVFRYKVRDRSGRVVQGELEAVDGRELRRKLDERDYFLIEYAEKKARERLGARQLTVTSKRVRLVDLSVLSWQLYTMLDAGMTLTNCLKAIANQTKHPVLRSTITEVCQRVEAGASFSEALREHPKVFSRFYVQMVNAGEVGGVQDEMIRRLAEYYEMQADITARIKSALTYPVLLLTASAGVITFLICYVLPQFATVFRDVGVPVPWPTQVMLNFSAVVRRYWIPGLSAGIFATMAAVMYGRSERGKLFFDRFVLYIPIVRELVQKSIACRFTQTLASLVSGGIPILTALDVVTDTIGNRVVSRALKHVSARVGEGKPIAQPLAECGIFPDMVVDMIRVGEESGALDKMLEKVADFYERDIKQSIETFTKLIEPVLMVVMAVIIGGIALTIFLPMSEILQSVQGR